MKKFKFLKTVLSLALILTVVTSITSAPIRSNGGTVSTMSVDDWGWMIETQ